MILLKEENTCYNLSNTKKQGNEDRICAAGQERRELWKKNLSAFYLTAYLCAKRALNKGVESAILDIGLKSPIVGSKVFAALKGAVDAGLDIPHGDFIFPADERIRGEHVAEYAESLDAEEVAKKFSKYFERGLNPKDLPENFDETIKNIDEAEV